MKRVTIRRNTGGLARADADGPVGDGASAVVVMILNLPLFQRPIGLRADAVQGACQPPIFPQRRSVEFVHSGEATHWHRAVEVDLITEIFRESPAAGRAV
jgi:hypothetical protein